MFAGDCFCCGFSLGELSEAEMEGMYEQACALATIRDAGDLGSLCDACGVADCGLIRRGYDDGDFS